MRRKMTYETPDLEVTKFDINKILMADFGDGDGDIVTDFGGESAPDDSGDFPLQLD